MRTKKQMKNKKKKKGGSGKIFFIIIFLVILVSGTILGYKVYKNGGGLQGLLATAMGHNSETLKNLPKVYCLLLGQSENLTDTIMIAEYDPQMQQASILSIPRDTFIGSNPNVATAWDKINAIYQIGPENVLKEVNELTGLDIQYYLKVDTQAFKALVDAIGGVTFDVPIDMTYDDNRQNLHIDLKAGVQVLDGDKAEQLVRFRHNNDGTTYPYEYGIEDEGRMRTQREFLKELAKQTLKVENLFKINEFIDIANQYIETNIDFSRIKDYVPYAVEFDVASLRTEQLPGVSAPLNGLWFYVADEEETVEIIDELFLNPEEEEIDTSSINTYGIDKSQIKIELLNGTNSEAKLEKIKNRLEKAGYTVEKTAQTSQTESTMMIYRGEIETAIQEELKLLVETENTLTAEATEISITIILGQKD